jgi:hypothetical protein
MTVEEVIKKLRTLDPKTELLVSVRTYTGRSAHTQVTPFEIDKSYGGATLHISLPQGFYVGKRKGAQGE